jgi:energy-coupling factor transporter ATP-binding protein EcfA2
MGQSFGNHSSSSFSQSTGEIRTTGDDNVLNIVQGETVTITVNQQKTIQVSIDEIKTRELIKTSPYKGLKPFESKAWDIDRFFGRTQFIEERLLSELAQTQLLLLLGASGSGKSSVIKAGLIPRLTEEYGDRLVVVTLTPDRDPFEGLYISLCGYYDRKQAEKAQVAQAETLMTIVQQIKPPESHWLIFVDQFEELFTTSQPQKCQAFVASLVKLNQWLIQQGDRSVQIVATMRSDFSDRLNQYPKLVNALKNRCLLITEMQPDELQAAIEQPAAQHGVVFESGLVKTIVQDIQGQAGCLPLLQYTLNLLWETKQQDTWDDRTLTRRTYEALGGVRGALQQHVERIYSQLSPTEQLATQQIFLKLIEIGGDQDSETDWKPIRRRALQSQFADATEQRLLTQLIKQNLLVSNAPILPIEPQFSLPQGATIEIAHEVLLTSWTKLNHWITENRQAIALRNRLETDVERWQHQRGEDELWSGSKLARALELKADPTFQQVLGGFSDAANQFLDASLGLRERKHQKELRVARRLTAAIAVSALTLIGAIGFGWRNTQQLQKNTLDNWSQVSSLNVVQRQSIFQDAERQAEAYRRAGDIDKALAYYRRIRAESLAALQQQIPDRQTFQTLINAPLNQEAKTTSATPLLAIAKRAEKQLTELVRSYRLKDLIADLNADKFGGIVENPIVADLEEQYTEGALKKTYQILMQTEGVRADLNQNGSLDTQLEADQIPCEILKELEKLWQEKGCSWYEQNPYLPSSPNCKALKQTTLSYLIFAANLNDYPIAVDRIKTCKANPNP